MKSDLFYKINYKNMSDNNTDINNKTTNEINSTDKINLANQHKAFAEYIREYQFAKIKTAIKQTDWKAFDELSNKC